MRTIQSSKHCNITKHAGFSLIELMVGLTLSLILLAGLVTVVTNTNQSYREMSLAGQQVENGRYAIELLSDDIQHAGFYGSLRDVGDPPATLPDPCATDTATLAASFTLAIQGYDLNTPTDSSSLSCVATAQHKAGTDILVIRRAATTVESGTLATSQYYLQSNTTNSVLDTGGSGNLTLTYQSTTAAPIHRYITHIYFVSPCKLSTCDDTSENIPTLKRLELNNGGTFTTVPLVDGVDDLQLDYGIDSDGNGSPDSFITNPTLAQFSQVVAVDIHLLARNTEPTVGYDNDRTYDMGRAGPTSDIGDNYKRHAYSAMVRAVNLAGRRE